MRRYLLLLASAILLTGMANQTVKADSDLKNDLQAWQVVTLQTKTGPGKRILGYLEVQPRTGNLDSSDTRTSDFSALIIRPAIGYQVNKHVSLWQGYAWAPQFLPFSRHENRLFQQMLIENKLKKITLVNRTRLEQRWLEGADRTSVRLRHMLRAAYPLGKNQKWSLVGSNELFVNLNSVEGGPQGGVDQNRVFLGLHRKFNKHVNAEAGYLNQYINAKDPIADRMNHVILLTVNFSL